MNAFISSDRYFDPQSGRLSAYFSKLFILIGQESVQYCILDTERNTFVTLADFRLPVPPRTPEVLYAELVKLISEEEALKKAYPSVVLGLDTPQHTMVPSPLYDPMQNSKYLEFNFGMTAHGQVRTDQLEEIDAFNIYGIPKGLLDIVRENYRDAAVVHRSSAFIRAIYNHRKINSESQGVYLNVKEQSIDLASIEGKRLVFFNSYTFSGKEDILYYILYAMEQLNLSADNVKLYISGMLDTESESHRLLGQYIKQLSFADRLNLWNYSPLLEQSPAHRYHELYALALCGS
jgi:hypothetical protein